MNNKLIIYDTSTWSNVDWGNNSVGSTLDVPALGDLNPLIITVNDNTSSTDVYSTNQFVDSSASLTTSTNDSIAGLPEPEDATISGNDVFSDGDTIALWAFGDSNNGISAGETTLQTSSGLILVRLAINGTLTDYVTVAAGDLSSVAGTTISDVSGSGGASASFGVVQYVCFCAGTLIEVGNSQVAIDDLEVGDMLLSKDRGLQPLRWIGKKEISAEQIAANPKLRPIKISAGALGAGVPSSDLYVSPQHRIMLSSKIAERMFGVRDILVPAVKLLGLKGVETVDDGKGVTYYHILLDHHEIVQANGAPCETLYLGEQAKAMLSPEAIEEIATIFPDLVHGINLVEGARKFVSKRSDVEKMIYRHEKNGKALFTLE